MTQEQSVLLAVLRHAINPELPLPDTDCDWNNVWLEARQQAVSLIFYDAVAPITDRIPQEVQQKIRNTGMQVVMTNINIGNTQARLTALLQERKIPHLILKGEASAAYYPKPQLRTLGDVDFWVRQEDFASLHAQFQELGYRFDASQHDHHITYDAPGGTLEMHKTLPGLPDGKPGKILQDYLKNLPERTGKTNIGSGEFSAPDQSLHGLILLLHSQHHLLGEGLGLRHLMDWCCYVNQTSSEPFWEEDLIPLLKKIGLYRFAVTLTGVCKEAFLAPCPAWAAPGEALCKALLEDILSGGNFGRKDATRQASGLMVSREGKLKTLFRTFHASVKAHHPICEKCGLLYIVFYPLRGIRYLWLILTGKRESLLRAIPQADQRRTLYGGLKIFEVEENG